MVVFTINVYQYICRWVFRLCMTVLDACTTAEDGGSLPHCHNNGVCENGSHGDSPGTFSCVCPAGFTGPTCEQGLTSSFLSCPLLLSPFFTLSWLLSHRRCLLVLQFISAFLHLRLLYTLQASRWVHSANETRPTFYLLPMKRAAGFCYNCFKVL